MAASLASQALTEHSFGVRSVGRFSVGTVVARARPEAAGAVTHAATTTDGVAVGVAWDGAGYSCVQPYNGKGGEVSRLYHVTITLGYTAKV